METEGTFFEINNLDDEIESKACPPIDGALPSWPYQLKERAEWIGLCKDRFVFTHHSSHSRKVDLSHRLQKGKDLEEIFKFEEYSEDLFCEPISESDRLLAILQNSKGGSILVTGYRGTGKSSLVNYAIAKLIDQESSSKKDENNKIKYIPIRINLSTSRTAMALIMMMIKELYHHSLKERFEGSRETKIITEIYKKFIGLETFSNSTGIGYSNSYGAEISAGLFSNLFNAKAHGQAEREKNENQSHTVQANPYTLHEAQQDLHRCLKELSSKNYRIIFLLDELDKLTPQNAHGPSTPYNQKMTEIQTIVSDLKFLLTEANAFHIFIAGKDVDDSWQEDQNKGEGLFESVFIQNIYLPSTFTVKLKPAIGSHKWILELLEIWKNILNRTKDIGAKEELCQKIIGAFNSELILNNKESLEYDTWKTNILELFLGELGIKSKNWTYNTGLIIIPYLSKNELFKMLIRYGEREVRDIVVQKKEEATVKEIHRILEAAKENKSENTPHLMLKFIVLLKHLAELNKEYKCSDIIDIKKEKYRQLFYEIPTTERRTRRIRNLIQYLTYKGRGIPRKILREFYTLVQSRNILGKSDSYWKKRGDIHFIIFQHTALRQKITFFSNIVSLLQSNQNVFRSLDDKGCVASFHIIDYVLKFYQTGFSWSDIETASFMTQREELFPSRVLVSTILEILEGHLISRIERRQQLYGLLPKIKHDLAQLYLTFGPEQIELRFTKAEFSSELNHLLCKVQKVDQTMPEQRLESFKSQIRIGKLYELLGNFQEARHEYSKALRWIRMDLSKLDFSGDNILDNTTAITYISIAVDLFQKIGYLYELNSEFNTAFHYYQSGVRFIESTWPTSDYKKTKESILGKRMRPHITSDMFVSSPPPDGQNAEDSVLKLLIELMVPGKRREVTLFTGELGWENLAEYDLLPLPGPLYSAFEPIGFGSIINCIAVVLEKLWYRTASNRFMLMGLDLYRRLNDEHGLIEQMIFIGEMAMRRRDVRLAASWYLLALKRMSGYQKCDNIELSSKQAGIHSTTRAKLFEYLGDIYFATGGTAFLPAQSFVNRPVNFDEAIKDNMKKIRDDCNLGTFDDKDNEFFYSLAAYQYGTNNHLLRECDVYLKKIGIRYRELSNVMKEFNFEYNSLLNDKEQFGDAIQYWCNFWLGVEQILNALLDSRPNMKKIQPLDKGRIVDRRRFGELFTLVGRMFSLIAKEGFWNWYWVRKPMEEWSANAKKEYIKHVLGASQLKDASERNKNRIRATLTKTTDLLETAHRIDRVIGYLIDCVTFEETKEERKNIQICLGNRIGNRSPLWQLASLNWKEKFKIRRYKTKSGSGGTATSGMKEIVEIDSLDSYLTGTLYYICENIEELIPLSNESGGNGNTDSSNDNKAGVLKTISNDISRVKNIMKNFYMGEISLLGANLALDDNLRDLESADACHRLGDLYLSCIKLIFDLKFNIGKMKSLNIIDGDANSRLKSFEKDLSLCYSFLHIAAKRFLTNAVDIYNSERSHTRCTHYALGCVYRAQAELLFLRAEILYYANIGNAEESNNERNSADSINGLDASWENLDKYIKLQKKHISDDDIFDVRNQVSKVYRSACKQYLLELEDYTKRYRFPSDVYYLHKNIMDGNMHFDICSSIYERHWNYKQSDKCGRDASEDLIDISRRMGAEMFNPPPRVRSREKWLSDLFELMTLIDTMSPTGSYIHIEIIQNNDGVEKYIVKWCDESSKGICKDIDTIEEKRKYFRSYDDGLGVGKKDDSAREK